MLPAGKPKAEPSGHAWVRQAPWRGKKALLLPEGSSAMPSPAIPGVGREEGGWESSRVAGRAAGVTPAPDTPPAPSRRREAEGEEKAKHLVLIPCLAFQRSPHKGFLTGLWETPPLPSALQPSGGSLWYYSNFLPPLSLQLGQSAPPPLLLGVDSSLRCPLVPVGCPCSPPQVLGPQKALLGILSKFLPPSPPF